MKVAVMGAGAVGCYYGGMLARAGHDVVLIGRESHVAAVNRDGLDMDTLGFRERVPVRASTDPAAISGTELVLFCVKSTDTTSAAEAIRPHLGRTTTLLSLQNGVDNADRLRGRLEREVIAAVVYVACEMAGPGRLRHHGRGELVIGPGPAATRLVATFAAAGVPVEVSDNVAGALWSKLVLNCAYNALSAIARLPYGQLVQGEGITAVMDDAVGECLAVAAAEGVAIPGDVREAVRRIALTMPTQSSSTAQDLARGKRSEIDHLNGHVVRCGAAHGIPTPVNRTLHALVRLLESSHESRNGSPIEEPPQ